MPSTTHKRKFPHLDRYRREELAKIHIAKAELLQSRPGFTEETYRDILWQAGKVGSASELDFKGRQLVLARFKELGWKVKHKGKGVPREKSRPLAQDEWSRKIRALWLTLHDLGALRDSSEKALNSYVKRMVGIDDVGWIKDWKDACTVIEALKKWIVRVEKAKTEQR